MVLIIGFNIWIYLPFAGEEVNYRDRLVAHGCGSIDGYIQTNSKEALFNSLKRGLKNIEVDLYVTKDSQLVCAHDLVLFNKMCGRADSMPLFISDFKKSKIYGKYTPLTFKQLLDYQSVYNFTIWTDKISETKLLNEYIPYSLRSSVRIETFSLPDYQELKKFGYTPMYSATLRYKDLFRLLKDCFINKGLIDFIVVSNRSYDYYLRLLRKMGVKVAIYTQNNNDYIRKHILKEADYFYTDSL